MRIEDFKTGYHYFDYDTKNFDFAALVAKVLGTSEPLDQIHTEVSFSRLEFDNDQKSVLHRRYYESPLYREVVEMYNRFVKAKVLPLFDEKEFAVQKEPNFRVSIPENTAIGKNPYPESIGAKIIETIGQIFSFLHYLFLVVFGSFLGEKYQKVIIKWQNLNKSAN